PAAITCTSNSPTGTSISCSLTIATAGTAGSRLLLLLSTAASVTASLVCVPSSTKPASILIVISVHSLSIHSIGSNLSIISEPDCTHFQNLVATLVLE